MAVFGVVKTGGDFGLVDSHRTCNDAVYRTTRVAGLEEGPGVAFGHGRSALSDRRALIANMYKLSKDQIEMGE